MTEPLVWVPRGMESLVEEGLDGLEVAMTPEEPVDSPRLNDVEVAVLGWQSKLVALFSEMAGLKVVQTTSAGVDAVLPSIPPKVALCSARGSYGIVAEWVVGAILADVKDFATFRDEQRAGRWRVREVRRLAGATVLFVGYGSIAEGVEARLAPFGTEFLRIARTARSGVETLDALSRLLPEADVVVLLVPLTPDTDGLVDATFLSQIKDGALLVNAARGRVVDTAALIAALERGRLRAVLDVTDPEPLPENHPLFSAPNVFITPHIAGGALAREEVLPFIRAQLERYARGEPLANVVTDGY